MAVDANQAVASGGSRFPDHFAALDLDRMPVENSKPIAIFSAEEEREFLDACDDWQLPLFLTLMASKGWLKGLLWKLLARSHGWANRLIWKLFIIKITCQ